MATRLKMLAPNITYWAVPLAGLPAPAAPTAAQVTAGVNISCAIISGMDNVNPADSDAITTKSICDFANAAKLTRDNYEGELSFFKSDLVNVTALYNTVWALFKNAGWNGYIVRRVGKLSTSAAIATDKVDVFQFQSDEPKDMAVDDDVLAYTVKFLPQGFMTLGVALI